MPKKVFGFIFSQINNTREDFFGKEILQRRYNNMSVHHGGKIGKAGKILASKSSSKQSKSKAGTTLANHKTKCH